MDLTLRGTWDFQTKLVRRKGTGSEELDKAIKKDFIINKPEENRDQALASRADEDKCKRAREDISLSRSSISKSERLEIVWSVVVLFGVDKVLTG